jgi:hypothetical protein
MNIFKNINKYLVIYSVILSVALLAFYEHEKKLKVENLAYRQNVAVLMDSVAHYQVNDSLNASQMGELQLKLSEYKKYRKEDAELIKKLKADKPQTVIKTETKAEYNIRTELKDSIVYKDTLKTIDYTSYWTDLHGFISNDTLQIKIINREELMLVESIQRKRFLGIKLPGWLFGYKRETLDVVSKNPNTTIQDIEYIKLK